jgi:hypothetical protein
MSRLRAARASAGGSPVQWHSFAPEVLIPVLESIIEFQGLVPETDRRPLIREALHGAAMETNFDQSALTKELTASENKYLRKPLQKFKTRDRCCGGGPAEAAGIRSSRDFPPREYTASPAAVREGPAAS